MSTRSTWTHWLVLLLANILMAGNYYNYDMPAALGSTLQYWLALPDETFQYQLNSLYLASSLPNLFFPIVSGILVDRFGCPKILLLFAFILVMGQALFTSGLACKSYPLLIAGRFFLGLGGETVDVVVARILTDWFRGSSLALALGLNLMAARIVAAMNDNLSPLLAETSVPLAAWVGVGAAAIGFASAMALAWVNRDSSRVRSQVRPHLKMVSVISADEESLESGSTGENSSSVQDTMSLNSETVHKGFQKGTLWTQLKSLPPSFHFLCVIAVVLYGATNPFFNISTTFFAQKWGMDPHTAGAVMSIPVWIATAGNPLTGLVLDRIGHRASSLVLSALVLGSGHAVLQFSTVYPTVGMTLIGIAFAIFSTSIWACIPFIVRESQIATGFGIGAVAMNLAFFVFPLIVASIRNASRDFKYVEFTFMGLCALGALLAWLLCIKEPALNRVSDIQRRPVVEEVQFISRTDSAETLVVKGDESGEEWLVTRSLTQESDDRNGLMMK
ncbi:major facilitator superfamily domain-containing protein [Chytriomyces sp. MP71]|nr:major facilitator superfamily domain-containing protein [Chytriomyces sp. MP71]